MNWELRKAILAGYGTKLMTGRFPIVVLQIEMDPLIVDVNVHPTKEKVRLTKENELIELVQKSIEEVLKEEVLIPSGNLPPRFNDAPKRDSLAEQIKMPLTNHVELDSTKSKASLAFDSVSETFYVPTEAETDQALIEEGRVNDKQEKKSFPELDYFGQMHGTYLFAQSEAGLYIVDQHAAQERIKYEYYRRKIGEVSEDYQELLVPLILDFPSNETLKIKEQQKLLEKVGIFLEDFGANSFIVRSHPTWYPQGKEETTIREMIEILLETGEVNVGKFREDSAIMMSCKLSIKANHYLNDAQARQLITDLAKCDNPFNCPHGRPVLTHLTNYDLERMFKRVQDSH